ncbi:MAG: DUF6883 domain-containing protein [Candidatus Hydrogenedentota bacterium]
MKLPEARNAIIDRRKIADYCLSSEHDDGRHKAYLFRKLLGLTEEDTKLLLDALRQAAITGDAIAGKADLYGQRYTVDFGFVGPGGAATIRSAWIVRTGEHAPRLVSCFIL